MPIKINPNLDVYNIYLGGKTRSSNVKGVTLVDGYDFILKVGEKKELDFTVTPVDAIYTEILWESKNHKIATIDEEGVVTGVSEGKTTVYVEINGIKDTVNVTVINPINFKDKNVKKLCLKVWDKNGDGELTYAEAKAITSIPVGLFANSNIKTFDELKYFTSLTSVSQSAFEGCKNLTSVSLPQSLESIGKNAFKDCDSLETIDIPAKVDKIGSYAFTDCDKLTYIIMQPIVPPKCGTYIFGIDTNPEMYSIKVPGAANKYYVDEKSDWYYYRSYINPYGFDYTFDFILS